MGGELNGKGNEQFVPSSVGFVPVDSTSSEVVFG